MPTQQRLEEINQIIMRETMRAEDAVTAHAFEILQPLYAEKNAHGVDLSQTVYRLLYVDHLCDDLLAGRLTMPNIGPAIWNDPLENVLRDATFPDPATGGHISVRSLMDSYYGNCWTYQPESTAAWSPFGTQPTKVRIESTVGQLLAALMHRDDPYYSLHFYAGLVQYCPPVQLQNWPHKVALDDMLDSEGRNLSLALSVVRDDFVDESEVRLIYSHHENDPWVKSNVSCLAHNGNLKGFVRVPCRWDGLINSITMRSDLPTAASATLTNALASARLTAPVLTSVFV